MLARLFIVGLLALTPVDVIAQGKVDVAPAKERAKEPATVPTQELDAVIVEAKSLDSPMAIVTIKSRAAMLVSFADPVRSETIFLELWKYVSDLPDSDFDRQQARLVILKELFPRNPKLARQLLADQAKRKESSSESSTAAGADDQRFAGKLASQLMDVDPSAAAAILEQSLSISSTTSGVGALTRLRERDSFLSDYVASKALEALKTQPTKVSLPGVTVLTAYVFPGPDVSITSIEAEGSLQSLQYKYFLAGYDVLKASLRESNEALLKDLHYTPNEVMARATFQGQVSAILAALAPRLQPSLAAELTSIAAKLAPQVPANISQMTQSALARLSGNVLASEDPEQLFFHALTAGDFGEADRQLERVKDDKKKDVYAQLLNKNHAKALLARSDVIGALTLIRKLDDQTARLVMYLEAMKAVKKKHDPDLLAIVINEARLLIPQTDRNGLHVRALLSFVSQLTEVGRNDDAVEFLNSAVVSINALGKKTNDQDPKTPGAAAWAELNDPNSLIDAQELETAFSRIGLFDLDGGLAQARRIQPRPLQLAARLDALQGVIKRTPRNSKPPNTPKAASLPKE